jgi:hypothetical protein
MECKQTKELLNLNIENIQCGEPVSIHSFAYDYVCEKPSKLIKCRHFNVKLVGAIHARALHNPDFLSSFTPKTAYIAANRSDSEQQGGKLLCPNYVQEFDLSKVVLKNVSVFGIMEEAQYCRKYAAVFVTHKTQRFFGLYYLFLFSVVKAESAKFD